MQIDQYGFEAMSVDFHRRKLQPYRVAEAGDVTYLCFDNGDLRPIHRITKTGSETVIEWAFGAWADRATLSYLPINQTRNV